MSQMLDAAGRRRSPATMPGFHAGRPPRNKGVRYPADLPTVEEIVSVMRAAGNSLHGQRLRGLIAVLWRVEMAHEGVPLIVSQRQLGHSNLGITSIYLQGIDNAEIIDAVHALRVPMIPERTAR